MSKDINLFVEDTRFNFRVACILTNGSKVLLHKKSHDNFWNMVGGHVQNNESTLEAIIREIKEELGIEIQNPKLINVSENFFSYNNIRVQELLFVYVYDASKDIVSNMQDFNSLDYENERDTTIYHWFEKNEVESIVCKPEIIYKLIKQNCTTLTHNIDKK